MMLMGIRRLIKQQKDSVSLVCLLEEIKSSPQLLSREKWIQHFNDQMSKDETRNKIIRN